MEVAENKVEVINNEKEKTVLRIPRKDSPKWRKPVEILIKTRDELFKFAYDNKTYPDDDIRSFMPVNSFTAPEALFDEDEYITKEAQAVVRRLEEKQVYSFEKYLKLLDAVKEKEILKPIDASEAFYAWGFTGLRSVICDKERIELPRPLTEASDDNSKDCFEKIDYTFMDRNGDVYKEIPEGWNFVNTAEERKSKAAALKDSRTWAVLKIFTNVSETAIEYRFEKIKIVLSPSKYVASAGGFQTLHNTIRVLSPNVTFLPYDYWAVDSPEIREKLLEYTQIQSVIDYITDIVTVKSNASSYYMYRALSFSPKAAVEAVLHKQRSIMLNKNLTETKETLKYIEENGREAMDDIEVLKFGITNVESVFALPDDCRETSSALVRLRDKIMDGEINLDGIVDGSRIDAAQRDNGITDFITAAVEKLGYTFNELLKEAEKINPTPDIPYEFVLEKKGIRISLELPLRNAKLLGYKSDLIDNRNFFAGKDLHWCIVTDVYAEPGESFARHAAVRMKTWPHYLYKKDSSITYIENALKEILKTLNDDEETLDYDTAQIIYRIYAKAFEQNGRMVTLKMPIGKSCRNTAVKISSDIAQAIPVLMEDRFDGTLEITDNMISGETPFFLIMNAIITPYWVCPLFGGKFEVSSLFLAWKYGSNNENTEGYGKCISNGWLTGIQRKSLLYSLDPTVRDVTRLCEGSDDDWDIRQYCYNMLRTDEKTGEFVYPEPFKHPWDIKYPNFSNEFAEELQKDKPSPKTRSKRKLELVSAADMLKNDFTMDLYNVLFAARDIEPQKKDLALFRGLKVEEMSDIDDADSFVDIFREEIGDVRVISYRNNIIMFEDGMSFVPKDIPGVDSKYAVRKITENVYLGYFRSGCVRIEI